MEFVHHDRVCGCVGIAKLQHLGLEGGRKTFEIVLGVHYSSLFIWTNFVLLDINYIASVIHDYLNLARLRGFCNEH